MREAARPEEMFLTIGKRESWMSTAAARWFDERFRAAGIDEHGPRFAAFQVADDGTIALLPTPSAQHGVSLRKRAGNGPTAELPTRLYTFRIHAAVKIGQRIPLRVSEDGKRLVLDGVTMPREEVKP